MAEVCTYYLPKNGIRIGAPVAAVLCDSFLFGVNRVVLERLLAKELANVSRHVDDFCGMLVGDKVKEIKHNEKSTFRFMGSYHPH